MNAGIVIDRYKLFEILVGFLENRIFSQLEKHPLDFTYFLQIFYCAGRAGNTRVCYNDKL